MKKNRRIPVLVILLFSCVVLLTGCNFSLGTDLSKYLSSSITQSGEVSYYAGLGDNERENSCVKHHIEVSGNVTKTGYRLFYIGDKATDGMKVMLRFSEEEDGLDEIEVGDHITVHGVCVTCDSGEMVLDECLLSDGTETVTKNTTQTTTADTGSNDTADGIAVPLSSEDCEGKNYTEVQELLQNAGFTNVVLKPVEVSSNDAGYEDGEVLVVGTGDDSTFAQEDLLSADTKIIIGYAVLTQSDSSGDTTTTTTTTGNTETTTTDQNTSDTADNTSEDNTQTSTETQGEVRDYVLNTNSMKFHYPDCASVKKMRDYNRKDVTDTRENLIAEGYSPCKNCNP